MMLPSGKRTTAARYFYERDVGPIPEGKILRRVCDTPKCVNPQHHEPRRHAARPVVTREQAAIIIEAMSEVEVLAEVMRRLRAGTLHPALPPLSLNQTYVRSLREQGYKGDG